MSPALAGRVFTATPPGKPCTSFLNGDQQTIALGTNPSYYLFLYSSLNKNNFYVVKWWRGGGGEENDISMTVMQNSNCYVHK